MVISVSSYAMRIQRVLESHLPQVWIQGEISNFTEAASGHWYFNLKDAQAQLRCVMFRSRNQRLDWRPANGLAVELKGPATFYAPGGSCQVTVEFMRRAGQGALFEAFTKLKEKLAAEGLFDPARKRPLPAHPRTIGIVTSTAAAALRDVLTTLQRRAPATPIILYPTPVQGDTAAGQIAQAIATAGRRAECDVLILCRGGGSIEDLWAFNEEVVARAIAACPIPVISGVGHETDFTIADFVADQRAPTPTAAAELVSPDRQGMLRHLGMLAQRLRAVATRQVERDTIRLDHLVLRLTQATSRILERRKLTLDGLQRRLVHPGQRLQQQQESLKGQSQRLGRAMAALLERRHLTLQRLAAGFTHLNPEAVLARGFSIVRNPKGNIVRASTEIAPGDTVALTFASGTAQAQVTETDA
ncbi:MAG: exodeoxyribonuclease VII large subunit [Betaproteobacteria bacterium]|nr:exodeoxyribonuclease VII large subunit [Betaproteobacteria bacterium]MDE2622175.1 exodeoxyribonuclease VII large subunit [Betaproteobacteria bacterium]